MLSLLQYNFNIKIFTLFDSHQRSWFSMLQNSYGQMMFQCQNGWDCLNLALQFIFILVLRIVDVPQ